MTRDEAGRATELLGAHVDVTPLRNTELALAESDARLRMAQDALGIGTWEWMPDQRSVWCSQTMAIMWGFNPHGPVLHLKKILSRVHPDDRAYFRERMDAVATTGSFKSEFRVECPTADGQRKTIWVSARGTQLKSSEATRLRLTGIAYDITERKRADELMAIAADEVEHRAKNTLALVSGLLRMTKAESAGQLVQVMEGRIAALSSTMGLLSNNKWSGTSIREIIESGLAPFVTATGSDENNATLTGPNVIIDADSAQPLAMAIHELSTNASKYGALSVPNGRLKVAWESDGPVVKIFWTETGGPRLDGAPKRSGFGSKLVALLFEGQLRGNIVRDWNADGLTCTLTFSVNVTQLAAGAKTG